MPEMKMKNKYRVWIANNIVQSLGLCKVHCESMMLVFPELKIIRGHYFCALWGEREHWWLLDEDEIIVDPTAMQFPSKGEGVYIPWIEGEKEPTGRCLNCGEYVYDDDNVHEACYEEMVSSLNVVGII